MSITINIIAHTHYVDSQSIYADISGAPSIYVIGASIYITEKHSMYICTLYILKSIDISTPSLPIPGHVKYHFKDFQPTYKKML